MPQFSVRLENDDKVRTGLNRWAKSLRPISRTDMKAAVTRAKKRSIPFLGGGSYSVPERGYVRTGVLGRSADVIEDGLTVRIEVKAYRDGREYGEYVVGKGDGTGQAGIHAGYWLTMRDAVDGEIDLLTTTLDDDLQKSAEAVGL